MDPMKKFSWILHSEIHPKPGPSFMASLVRLIAEFVRDSFGRKK